MGHRFTAGNYVEISITSNKIQFNLGRSDFQLGNRRKVRLSKLDGLFKTNNAHSIAHGRYRTNRIAEEKSFDRADFSKGTLFPQLLVFQI